MVLVTRRFWIKGSIPFLKDGEEFSRVTAADFAAGAIAGAVFGEGEIIEEGFEGSLVDFCGFDEGAGGAGDTVDAAVLVIAEGIAGAVLHVADEDVVPVAEVERAIGREFQIDGPEVAVG